MNRQQQLQATGRARRLQAIRHRLRRLQQPEERVFMLRQARGFPGWALRLRHRPQVILGRIAGEAFIGEAIARSWREP
ncbi:hypothetical protein [Synechococcus sp. 1G10]|uniref:hypothetical protein n=1 Tax=Synechococcus sp. 1G10 TaxID=2025605 RepID=UPI000B98C3E5|nr:hypothetical protein [Synechococcus sp. 1G10]